MTPEEMAPRALVGQARDLRTALATVTSAPLATRGVARSAYEAARDELVYQQLAELPLARLKETTQGRLMLAPIEAVGYRTVGQASAAGVVGLQRIPGVGPETAAKIVGAANQLRRAMKERVRLRFDPDARPPRQTSLLAALCAYGKIGRASCRERV